VKIVIGIALILAGAIIAIFGHKPLPVKEGRLMRFLGTIQPNAKINAEIQSILIGVLIIAFGLSLIIEIGA